MSTHEQDPPPDVPPEEVPTLVQAAHALGEVGRGLLAPVGSILGDQATRVEGLGRMVRDLDSGYLRVVLAVDGLAVMAMGVALLTADLPDPAMFVLMEALAGIALLRYIRACVRGLTWRRWGRGVLIVALFGSWALLLLHRIPAEPIWTEAAALGTVETTMRPALPILWGAVLGHAFVAVAVLLHLPLRRYLLAARRRGRLESGARSSGSRHDPRPPESPSRAV